MASTWLNVQSASDFCSVGKSGELFPFWDTGQIISIWEKQEKGGRYKPISNTHLERKKVKVCLANYFKKISFCDFVQIKVLEKVKQRKEHCAVCSQGRKLCRVRMEHGKIWALGAKPPREQNSSLCIVTDCLLHLQSGYKDKGTSWNGVEQMIEMFD